MSENDYCYDEQLGSIEGWLCQVCGHLEEIKELLKENKNPLGIVKEDENIKKYKAEIERNERMDTMQNSTTTGTLQGIR